MGFIPDIERIFNLTPFTRQTLFFSATMATEIERLTNTFLSAPLRLEIARQASASENIKQSVILFKATRKDREGTEKRKVLRDLILKEGKDCKNAIIFCNRKTDVDICAKSLKKYGFNAAPIHGDLDQKNRMNTLDDFRTGSLQFLVASDVAARGLDIPSVSHVYNFDVPTNAEDYVHRIGRTGRAGRNGKALMISTPRDEKNFKAIEKLIQLEIPLIDNFSFDTKTSNEEKIPENKIKNTSRSRPPKNAVNTSIEPPESEPKNRNNSSNSSENKNEFGLPIFITKSFVERQTH
jgi:ATP-dependent RNA helicase RhlE